jgi:hypothetical protein
LALVAGAAALAPPARAFEGWESCDDMLVTVVRFTGTVTSVQQLGERDTTVTDVGDVDPAWAVAMTIDEVDPGAGIQPGAAMTFAVHSPTRSFGSRPRAGAVREMELESAACHGTFWRYFGLRPRSPSRPQPYTGGLEVGRSYRAAVRWDPQVGRVLEGTLDLPMHHGGEIDFLNPEAAPALGPERRSGSMVFEVVSRRVQYVAESAWLTTYSCRIARAAP